jgi:hypothetical protein
MIQTTNGFTPRGSEAGDRPALERPPAAGRPDEPGRGDAVRVVIADDAVLLRTGVARLLAEAGFEVLAQAGDADELVRKVRAYRPDVGQPGRQERLRGLLRHGQEIFRRPNGSDLEES